MGSAAVLAVYSAGYLRTRDAAAAIEREAAARPSRAAHVSDETTALPDTIAAEASNVPDNTSATEHDSAAAVSPSVAPIPAVSSPVVATTDVQANKAKPATSTVHAAGADSPTQPKPGLVGATAKASASDSAHSPDSATVVAPPVTKTATSGAGKTNAAKDSSAVKVAPESAAVATKSDSASTVAKGGTADSSKAALPPLRDGTFTGYGTSRHGDIEATIEIRDGRITAATISQCLTRYSCSWIEMLPAQVVARQTADVDVVSGATQSSDAFYFAVLAALKISRGK